MFLYCIHRKSNANAYNLTIPIPTSIISTINIHDVILRDTFTFHANVIILQVPKSRLVIFYFILYSTDQLRTYELIITCSDDNHTCPDGVLLGVCHRTKVYIVKRIYEELSKVLS